MSAREGSRTGPADRERIRGKDFVSASDVLFVYLMIFFHLSKTRECSWKFNTLQTFR